MQGKKGEEEEEGSTDAQEGRAGGAKYVCVGMYVHIVDWCVLYILFTTNKEWVIFLIDKGRNVDGVFLEQPQLGPVTLYIATLKLLLLQLNRNLICTKAQHHNPDPNSTLQTLQN